MNYTNELKEKLKKYPEGEILEVSEIYDKNFQHIPEGTFYKIIERMVSDKQLIKIAKGIYTRPEKTRFGDISISENKLISYYTGDQSQKGVVAGYHMYNKYGITTQISKITKIYSNNISQQTKTVKYLNIKRISIEFNPERIILIEALEILENFNEIEDLNVSGFIKFIDKFIDKYNDKEAKKVLNAVKYKKRTIAFLKKILDYHNKENTLAEYLSSFSTYKSPELEELYELAS